jgi:hypothetical protein
VPLGPSSKEAGARMSDLQARRSAYGSCEFAMPGLLFIDYQVHYWTWGASVFRQIARITTLSAAVAANVVVSGSSAYGAIAQCGTNANEQVAGVPRSITAPNQAGGLRARAHTSPLDRRHFARRTNARVTIPPPHGTWHTATAGIMLKQERSFVTVMAANISGRSRVITASLLTGTMHAPSLGRLPRLGT